MPIKVAGGLVCHAHVLASITYNKTYLTLSHGICFFSFVFSLSLLSGTLIEKATIIIDHCFESVVALQTLNILQSVVCV